jgi:7-cyano-7-deazaguanine synthase
VLLSGGLDSTTLLHYVRDRIGPAGGLHALSFIYGQKHSRELAAAAWQARHARVTRHHTIDLSFMGVITAGVSALTNPSICVPDLADLLPAQMDQPPTYVPNRNMVFLSIAAAYAESVGLRNIYYGAQAQDEYGYWDCTVDFVSRINHLLGLNRRRGVRIHAPFARRSKAYVLKTGLKLGVDYAHTWTCYRGARRPCGTCPSCVERAQAFRRTGVDDPVATAR